MPLILAVEPDRKQAAKIAAMARGPLHAELVVTSSAEGALAVLAERVPDLILTSQLLSPRDEAALADRLRELDGAGGARVQTLMIPVLAAPQGTREAKGGLLSRLRPTRGGDPTPQGCDPALFSAQITEYLERARDEREAETVQLRVPVLKEPPTIASEVEAPKPEDPVLEEPVHTAPEEPAYTAAGVTTPEPVEPILAAPAYMASDVMTPEPVEPSLAAPAYLASDVIAPATTTEPVELRLEEEPAYMAPELVTPKPVESTLEEPAYIASAIDAQAGAEPVLDAPPTVAWEELTLDDDDTAAPIELSSEMIDLDAFVSELEAEAKRENGASVHRIVEVDRTDEIVKTPEADEPLETLLDVLDPEPPIAAAPAAVAVAHPLSTHAAWPPLEGPDANETERDTVIEDFISALNEARRQDEPRDLWDEDEPVSDLDPDGDLWMPLPAAAQCRWPPMFGFAPVVPALPVLPVHPAQADASVEEARRLSPPPPPVQDEWGFFDPDRCGFNALRAKLEEIGK